MDQFSKVADGVALFLAVGRPGAKFQACFALLSSPTMFQEKDVKLIFTKTLENTIGPVFLVLIVTNLSFSN